MKPQYIVDTGPLVAFLNNKDKHHQWIRDVLSAINAPLITCEPVITESCFILKNLNNGRENVMEMVNRGIIKPTFQLAKEIQSIQKLLIKYKDLPISLADACLVRMVELNDNCKIITLDSDFHIYRQHSRKVIPVLTPK